VHRPVVAFLSSTDDRRRLLRCVFGLVLCGIGFSLLVRADLGLDPWDVFHQGVAERLGAPIGVVTVATGFVVLLAWIPLRERPGVGTILNALIIGTVMDLLIDRLPEPGGWPSAWTMLVVGVVLAGVGSGFYIGSQLGPGPRDGLMTGIARRGHSLRLVRTGIELAALLGGWALGGTVGVGTLVFAVAIGPLVQLSLEHLSMVERDRRPAVVTPTAGMPGSGPGR
jgi:uncharacterized membrane protein YczE